MADSKRPRLFANCDLSCEYPCYCGTLDTTPAYIRSSDAFKGLMHLVESELQEMVAQDDCGIVSLEIRMMTDEEVAALPEI